MHVRAAKRAFGEGLSRTPAPDAVPQRLARFFGFLPWDVFGPSTSISPGLNAGWLTTRNAFSSFHGPVVSTAPSWPSPGESLKYWSTSRSVGGRGQIWSGRRPRLSGEIVHQGAAYPGQHKAIIDPELWRIVQDKLTANRHERSLAVGAEAPSLLAGLIVDADGNRMTPTHATKRAKRYRYYVSASLLASDRPQTKKGCAARRAISRGWCSTG
jgi:hypothetical protein